LTLELFQGLRLREEFVSTQVLKIGEVAQAIGVSADTLRHYERLGLLSKVQRTNSGYRLFDPSAVQQVRLVRNALQFGFALKQVAAFFHARESGRPPCHEVRAAGQEILNQVERQIRELQAARHAIRSTLDAWDQKLSRLPQGQPAELLDSVLISPKSRLPRGGGKLAEHSERC